VFLFGEGKLSLTVNAWSATLDYSDSESVTVTVSVTQSVTEVQLDLSGTRNTQMNCYVSELGHCRCTNPLM